VPLGLSDNRLSEPLTDKPFQFPVRIIVNPTCGHSRSGYQETAGNRSEKISRRKSGSNLPLLIAAHQRVIESLKTELCGLIISSFGLYDGPDQSLLERLILAFAPLKVLSAEMHNQAVDRISKSTFPSVRGSCWSSSRKSPVERDSLRSLAFSARSA
jgi:hypothetical protein